MAANNSPPTRPPQSPDRMLTDIARYLILVEDKDPEDVAEKFERYADTARRNGPSWKHTQEERENIREIHAQLGLEE